MKKLLIPLVLLLLLGGGGGGVYFYFFANKAEAATAEDGSHEPAEEEHAKEEGGGGGSHGEAPGHLYVELDPLILPIVNNDGISQVVSLVVALEVSDPLVAAEVEGMVPRLKDAFIQDMYGVLNEQAALKGGVIQVSYIKERLGRISNKVMGKKKVEDVLLLVVQQRPI